MKWWVCIYDDGTGEVSQGEGDRPDPRPGKVVRVAESYDTEAEAQRALDDYLWEIQEGSPLKSESRGEAVTTKQRRGLASMEPARQREIAQLGGQAVHALGRAHEFTSKEARQAGKKGGWAVSQDRDHMARIGRKGGNATQQNRAEKGKGAAQK